jgi:hypothetical protein
MNSVETLGIWFLAQWDWPHGFPALMVGRTPRSAADAPVGLLWLAISFRCNQARYHIIILDFPAGRVELAPPVTG